MIYARRNRPLEASLACLAKFSRRDSNFLREYGVQILAVVEARSFGNLGQVPIGVRQQLFDSFQPQPQHLGFGRPSHLRREPSFKNTPAHARRLCRFIDGDGIKRMIANETQPDGQLAVVQGQHLRGAAGLNSPRRDENRFGRRFAARHHPFEQNRRVIPDAKRVRHHAAKRRVRQFTENFVIVHADDRHFFGHRQVQPAAEVQDLLAADVIARHDSDGFGKRDQPAAEIFLKEQSLLFVSDGLHLRRPHRRTINMTRKTRPCQPLLKPSGALVGIIGSDESAERVVSKTPVNQMFGRQTCHLRIQGVNQGQTKTADRATQIHRRHPKLFDKRRHLRRFHPGDDAVSVPVFEPGGKSVGPLPFLALHGPFVMLPHKFGDAQKKPPAISPR